MLNQGTQLHMAVIVQRQLAGGHLLEHIGDQLNRFFQRLGQQLFGQQQIHVDTHPQQRVRLTMEKGDLSHPVGTAEVVTQCL